MALVKQLAATSDVLVQSMRPGAADDLGLSREAIAAVNPNLIYASFSAFGTSGPRAHRRGVDGVAQAESGLASIQNRVLGNLSFVDGASGLALSQAILIALMKRDRTGEVDPVDLCLVDTAVYLQAAPIAEFSATGAFVDQPGYDIRYPTVGVFHASDGPFYMAPYWEPNWVGLCALIGRPELVDDPRFADKSARGANNAELRELIGAEVATRPRAHWIAELDALGVLVGAVRDYADVLADPQFAANRSFEEHTMFDGRIASIPRAPFRFGGEPLVSNSAAPRLGDATDALLDELGVGDRERQRLRERGVVSSDSVLAQT